MEVRLDVLQHQQRLRLLGKRMALSRLENGADQPEERQAASAPALLDARDHRLDPPDARGRRLGQVVHRGRRWPERRAADGTASGEVRLGRIEAAPQFVVLNVRRAGEPVIDEADLLLELPGHRIGRVASVCAADSRGRGCAPWVLLHVAVGAESEHRREPPPLGEQPRLWTR